MSTPKTRLIIELNQLRELIERYIAEVTGAGTDNWDRRWHNQLQLSFTSFLRWLETKKQKGEL